MFLIDIFLFNYSQKKVFENSKNLQSLFDYIGEIDSLITIASIRADKNFKYCIPTLTYKKKQLNVLNIYHPMVKNCTLNSLNFDGKSIFITGSNMTGKSTFLRMILLNTILSQTIYTCFADQFYSSVMQSFSSIKINDNLSEGTSYFFKEVNLIQKMINETMKSTCNLFVIDEIFKGTNTIERISLAKSILEYLNTNENIVIASSHDLELLELLKKDFEMYYFTEKIENNKLYFDHIIKKGALATKNAIKIIELEGFPNVIVENAYETSRFLNNRN